VKKRHQSAKGGILGQREGSAQRKKEKRCEKKSSPGRESRDHKGFGGGRRQKSSSTGHQLKAFCTSRGSGSESRVGGNKGKQRQITIIVVLEEAVIFPDLGVLAYENAVRRSGHRPKGENRERWGEAEKKKESKGEGKGPASERSGRRRKREGRRIKRWRKPVKKKKVRKRKKRKICPEKKTIARLPRH